MTDAEVARYNEKITALANKWIPLLHLEPWHIDFILTRSHLREKESPMGFPTVAETISHWAYKSAVIEFFLPSLESEDEASFEHYFVHELMHVLLNEMQSWTLDRNHEESVATHLAKAFLTTYHSSALSDQDATALVEQWQKLL